MSLAIVLISSDVPVLVEQVELSSTMIRSRDGLSSLLLRRTRSESNALLDLRRVVSYPVDHGSYTDAIGLAPIISWFEARGLESNLATRPDRPERTRTAFSSMSRTCRTY